MTLNHKHLLALACALCFALPASAATTASPAGSAAPAKSRRTTAPVAVAAPASRRLEDVHIEGELEVPRVTFITVRQPHRFRDFTRATSVRSSRRMAAEATFPAWISPVPTTSQEARKENQK